MSHGINKIEIKFDYAGANTQGPMTKLEVSFYGAAANEEFIEADGVEGTFTASDPLLWKQDHHIEFEKGSNCIRIGGRRYCWG